MASEQADRMAAPRWLWRVDSEREEFAALQDDNGGRVGEAIVVERMLGPSRAWIEFRLCHILRTGYREYGTNGWERER